MGLNFIFPTALAKGVGHDGAETQKGSTPLTCPRRRPVWIAAVVVPLVFLQKGQACDRHAIGLISDCLFLHLRPPRVGILFIPRTPGFGIERSLHEEVVERATIVFQIEAQD